MIEHIKNYVKRGEFQNYAEVFGYVENEASESLSDDLKLAIQRNQEIRIGADQHQFFKS